MESIINSLNDYMVYIVGGMALIIVLLLILVLILIKSVNKLEKRFNRIMKGSNNKNLEELIINELSKIQEANNNSQEALARCEALRGQMKGCVQKVAIMRYKAFEDVGSDLSFSVAILDENNDGVLITGIYARQESTTYAKPIDKGISRYDLSEEEIYVLNEAVNKEVI